MSNPDSFFDEVAEEVRKDRTMAYVRRYGWIPALAIVAIVGGASWWEWQKAQEAATAQAFGDSVIAAMEYDSGDARAAALSEVPAEGAGAALRDLLAAGELSRTDSRAANDALKAIADNAELPDIYRDAARLRMVLLPETILMTDQRLALLEPLLAPGNPFRLTALEAKALIHVERGETDAALSEIALLLEDAEVSPMQSQRVQQLRIALGGAAEAQ